MCNSIMHVLIFYKKVLIIKFLPLHLTFLIWICEYCLRSALLDIYNNSDVGFFLYRGKYTPGIYIIVQVELPIFNSNDKKLPYDRNIHNYTNALTIINKNG